MSIEHNIFDIFQFNMWSVAQTMVTVKVKKVEIYCLWQMALRVRMKADHSLYVCNEYNFSKFYFVIIIII